MTHTLQQMILDLLKVNRDDRPAQRSWKSFSDREWEQALAWLDLGGLAIYFLRRMMRTNSLSFLPDRVRTELERRGADNRLRSTEILQEFRTIIDAFEDSHVKYAVLKGIALLPDYCAGLEFRTQYDHDVLIAPNPLNLRETRLSFPAFAAETKGTKTPPLSTGRRTRKFAFRRIRKPSTRRIWGDRLNCIGRCGKRTKNASTSACQTTFWSAVKYAIGKAFPFLPYATKIVCCFRFFMHLSTSCGTGAGCRYF